MRIATCQRASACRLRYARRFAIHWLGVALVAASMLAPSVVAASPANSEAPPVLASNTRLATAGYFQLRWTAASPGAGGYRFELEQRGVGGPQHWLVRDYRRFEMSGLPDGEYEYRVRRLAPDTSGWSDPVHVVVEHHQLGRALTLFGLGLVTFSGLVAVILMNRQR